MVSKLTTRSVDEIGGGGTASVSDITVGHRQRQRPGKVGRRVARGAVAFAGALTVAAGGMIAVAPAADAAPYCTNTQGFNVSTGGCDGDMQPGNVRMAIVCRVVGSYYEYNVYSAWFSRSTCWQTWLGCRDQGRVRVTWFQY
jgi:hypothetical protein